MGRDFRPEIENVSRTRICLNVETGRRSPKVKVTILIKRM